MTAKKPARARATTAPPKPADRVAAASFPIVGIGASAGGLAAFEAFFSGMPADAEPGMAFVLVQHLAPDHKSILTELIQRYTRMQVFEVEDGMVVRPNCAYIIPPGRDMAFLNGKLHLMEPAAPRGQRLPVDFFFRSLAQDQHGRAIGIVLSGTGSDGTLGIRAIKGEGGMTMAQKPESTEYDGMPRSALATGLVDYELPPAEMAARLMAYAAHAFGPSLLPATPPNHRTENMLNKIFILLRNHSGHDFSQYKPNTIHRRIERRMAIQQVATMEEYVKYLQQTPAEAEALLRDLLIGVTHFFRDPDAFLALEKQVIPTLFAGRPPGSVIRVWVPACSTGEEAYSLAILLAEYQETTTQSFQVQLFATDIDRQAIATARAGLYPASIAADLSPERLARFFTAEAGGTAYRIHKGIRDLLIFSEQNLIRDPPFSKLDLISCRNLLIYLGAEVQKKLIPLLHYALNPGGFLFLGTSETVGAFDDQFVAVDRQAKLYQRKDDLASLPRANLGRFLPLTPALTVERPRTIGRPLRPEKPSLRELTEQAILQQTAPAAALVNGQGDILYLHGHTGMFLEPSPGETGISNILKMARDGLRRELTTILHQAAARRETVRRPNLRVKTNSHFTLVNLTVCPVASNSAAKAPESPLYLVILEEVSATAAERTPPGSGSASVGAPGHPTPDADANIAVLKQELRAKDEYLQSANEELETSNEELKAANEEMQSVNEELQSTNEELETSKEELQSVNEELTTVNTELQAKVTDLSRANNDMNNLLAGTGIATIFVDHQLRILRFTPATTRLINLIKSDVGRPVGHLVSNLVGYNCLVGDIQAVLDTLVAKELEVRTAEGKSYTLRIQPYRTTDNIIEGAVVSFVDITELARIRESLRGANELLRLAVVVRDAYDAITMQDLEGRIQAWNPGAARLYGWSEAEALAMNVRSRIPAERREAEEAKIRQLAQAKAVEPYRTQRLTQTGAVVEVWIIATALVNETGRVYAIATTERAAGPVA